MDLRPWTFWEIVRPLLMGLTLWVVLFLVGFIIWRGGIQ